MRTFSVVKDLPVIDGETGKVLGKIIDLRFTSSGAIKGFIMDGKGVFERARYIPLDAIEAVGSDCVIISDPSLLGHDTSSSEGYSLYTHRRIAGKPVFTSSGEKLGLLEDVYFHEQLGKIEGYEISAGFFADLTEGKKRIDTAPLTIGEEAIIINTIM